LSDFLVLQVPYSPATHHLIGTAELARMKRTAILVNAARGGVVDDAALIEALNNRTIAAAGLDVFENEPKFDPRFLALKNVVLAPHIGSSTRVTRLAMAMTAARNMVAALTGGMPPNIVNPR
jgi:lactate dehydrogenase-like 2-hydroxyacid dehydrogenase